MGERHKALWDIAMRETGERKKESGKERRRDTGGRDGRHRDGERDTGDGTLRCPKPGLITHTTCFRT